MSMYRNLIARTTSGLAKRRVLVNGVFIALLVMFSLRMIVLNELSRYSVAALEEEWKTELRTDDKGGKGEENTSKKCLTFDEGFNNLVSDAKQIFIVVPPKAAGTTLRKFVSKCIGRQVSHADLGRNEEGLEKFMVERLHVPKVMAGHLLREKTLLDLLQHTTKNTLLIYVHREETARLRSAIKYVVQSVVCDKSKAAVIGDWNHEAWGSIPSNETHCEIEESTLINTVIKGRQSEISVGAPEIMTCEVYDKIERTAPKMVFLHYKQVDRLQKIIGEHHCPELNFSDERLVHENVASNKKMSVSVKLKNDERSIGLEEWIEAKGELLEWGFFQTKKEQTCVAEMRKMEEELFACEDEILMV
jgi:hypothetical protein